MPHSKTDISFLRFLKELRFPYLIGTSFLIFGFIYGAFEIFEHTVNVELDVRRMSYLHFSRGVITVGALLIWISWTLYEFRGRFREVVRQHDRQYQNMLNAATEAVIITNETQGITFWNPAAENLFGWSRDEVLGKKLDSVFKFKLPDVQSANNPAAAQEVEITCTDRNGQHHFVACTQTLLNDENSNLSTRMIMMRDLTKRMIRQAQMERSERLASLGHMAAGVAHEVGNPLTSISSIIQLLQRRVSDPTVLQQLERVRENINRITKIVRDLVDFSRPKSPQIVNMNLNDTIHDALGLLRHDARCKDVDFQVKADADLPNIKAIPDQLFQVFLNLILNAVDASRETQKPVVKIYTSFNAETISAAVEDNGPGVPDHLRERIFEPFFTTKEVGKGTGLGLSVSHHIITDLGGGIRLESKPGQTRFIVQIPHQS